MNKFDSAAHLFFMRHLLFLGLFVCTFCANAYNFGNNAGNCLHSLYNGYVEYSLSQLRKGANANDLGCQFYMAQCLELGIGCKPDAVAAFGMYRRAAERGFPPAMKELARCYQYGIGVNPNSSRETEWLLRFEKKNDGSSFPDIVEIYNQGIQHPENYSVNPTYNSKSSSTPDAVAPTQSITQQQIVVLNPIERPAIEPETVKETRVAKSDVDIDIPTTNLSNDNVFALIIVNEDYQEVAPVPNALNDGEIFAVYCKKTLGLPSENIHLVKNASLNNIRRELNLMQKIADAFQGDASFIFYYAGHGIPDEITRQSYIIPIDGFAADLSTCYMLSDLYDAIGKMPSAKNIVILDACFSGSQRGAGMIVSARGVALKPKQDTPISNTVVISSAQGDETAYTYADKSHGLFTYFLLKKLKETGGNVTLKDIMDYVTDNVKKKSLIVNGKQQTPTVNCSAEVKETWMTWKLN